MVPSRIAAAHLAQGAGMLHVGQEVFQHSSNLDRQSSQPASRMRVQGFAIHEDTYSIQNCRVQKWVGGGGCQEKIGCVHTNQRKSSNSNTKSTKIK